MLILILLSIFNSLALAEPSERFYPHISTPAQVLKPGEVAYENFPGATNGTPFYANSLSVGVLPWLQLGVVPIFYLMDENRYNLNLKVPVVEDNYFQAAIGYTRFSFALLGQEPIQETNGSETPSPYVDLDFAFVALNYRDPGSVFAYGLNYSSMLISSNSALLRKVLREQHRDQNSWAVDISYQLRRQWVLTFGMGEQLSQTFELQSPFVFGAGLSATYLRDADWFPRVSSGLHYAFSTHHLGLLINFDIFQR